MDKIEQLKIELQSLLQQGRVLIHQIPPPQLYVAIGVFFFTMAFLSLSNLIFILTTYIHRRFSLNQP